LPARPACWTDSDRPGLHGKARTPHIARTTPVDRAARWRLTERKAALLEHIAVEEGTLTAIEAAAGARALATQLRTELDQDENR
jgi:hypothetical protein